MFDKNTGTGIIDRSMIDPHVHLRDWNENHKETVKHGLTVAVRSGLDGVFEMPNTDPPLLSGEVIARRIALADRVIRETGISIFHGVFAAITTNPHQVEEMVRVQAELFPRVVGFKIFTAGPRSVSNRKSQQGLFKLLAMLGFKGLVALHCERQDLFKPELWNPNDPFTHTLVRPPEAEMESVRDLLEITERAGFSGTLHICHISTAGTLDLVEVARRGGRKVTCGVTPHHLLLCDAMMKSEAGLLLKANPPLRNEENRAYLLERLIEGGIDWLETDHAPHTIQEKLTARGGYPSGLPGFPVYPRLIRMLAKRGMSPKRITSITHSNITRTFGLDIPDTGKAGTLDLAGEYEFDPYNGRGIDE